MKTYTVEELKEILKKHEMWLKDEENGERANLSYANLSSADLSSADLSSADLSSADLSYANLSSADLSYANLRSANLRSADLSYANLSSADLRSANLRSADLSYANLRSANLRSAKTDERFIVISCIGSRNDSTIFNLTQDVVWCGCFKGTLEEFADKVNKTYSADNAYWKEYMGAINYVKNMKEVSQ